MHLSDYYHPFAKQTEFHECEATYRLFGGAAGPGKTRALLWEAILQANSYEDSDTLLLRRTCGELEDSLIKEFRRSVPRQAYVNFNDSKKIVTWHNGSRTKFGYCRNEKDVYQYQGGEYLFIGLDELTHFTIKQWEFLTSRNRAAASERYGALACMAGASNPGNVGHAWVKKLFIEKKPHPGMDEPALYNAREYEFIPARLSDNPIYANDKAYRRKLELLPGPLRRAFLEGDWNVFAGQYFDIFDVGRHVAEYDAQARVYRLAKAA